MRVRSSPKDPAQCCAGADDHRNCQLIKTRRQYFVRLPAPLLVSLVELSNFKRRRVTANDSKIHFAMATRRVYTYTENR